MAHRILFRQKHQLNILARPYWQKQPWIFYLSRLKILLPIGTHQNTQNVIRPVLFSTSSHKYVTHYDVLGIEKEATQKEIKEAYIKLGKECHPDMHQSINEGEYQSPGATNKNEAEITKKFTKINEAYEVLGRIESKRAYDISLRNAKAQNETRNSTQQQTTYKTYDTFEERAQAAYGYKVDPNYWNKNRDKYKIAWLCIGIMILGFVIHFQIARLTAVKHAQWLDNNTKNLNNSIEERRANAQKLGSIKKGEDGYNTLLAKYKAGQEAAQSKRNA